jgi:predicted membrane-bound spermidine synthase
MMIAVLFAESLTAFCALAFELAVTRLVAPHAGMSIDTWTAIISAFLLALALGHQIGGWIATGATLQRMFFWASFAAIAAGAYVALTPLIVTSLDQLLLAPAPTEVWRIILLAGLPCIPAGLLFGTVTPLLMTVAIAIAKQRGIVVGLVYAAGAAGSVLGVLAVLWLLLDTLGVRGAMLAIGILSLANGALLAALYTLLRGREAIAR